MQSGIEGKQTPNWPPRLSLSLDFTRLIYLSLVYLLSVYLSLIHLSIHSFNPSIYVSISVCTLLTETQRPTVRKKSCGGEG